MNKLSGEKLWLLMGGAVVGVVAVVLVLLGNPANMGFCIACFIRDTAGALGLHSAGKVQYLRPELIGLVLGAFILALIRREFAPRGGSSPFIRFLLGFGVMVGALVFLGCPLRMVLRLAGGDLNALVGLAGFICGILAGVVFLKKGFSLGRTYKQRRLEGGAFTAVQLALLVVLTALPALLLFSGEGPGSMRAPLVASLAAGLVAGAIAQRTRLCTMGGIRDVALFGDWTLASGFIAIFIAALVMNLITGKFNLGFEGQPIAHTDHVWNFLGLAAVGLGSVLLGGCPFRQMVLAGEGNTDAAVTVAGMLVGAAVSHNFKLASSTDGATPGGRIATVAVLVLMLAVALAFTLKPAVKTEKKEVSING